MRVFTTDEQKLQNMGDFFGQMPVFYGKDPSTKKTGAIFAWTWFKVEQEFTFPMHPHEGFEILTYMLEGSSEHSDTLSNSLRIDAGGAQLLQANSGASHSERLIGPKAHGFQLWFNPGLERSLRKKPTYHQYTTNEFPIKEELGIRVKTLVGEGSPMLLESDIKFFEIFMEDNQRFSYNIPENKLVYLMITLGEGNINQQNVSTGDYVSIDSLEDGSDLVINSKSSKLRVAVIETTRG